MDDVYRMAPIAGPLDATIRPPGSKSITNRALPCAALAVGNSQLDGALDSEDTEVMIACLRKLGIEAAWSADRSAIAVAGRGPEAFAGEHELFVGNSGTTIRFLTACLALGQGRFTLDGIARMRERPIGELLASLAQLGADAKSMNNNGCPPVVVNAHGLQGGRARLRGDISSQYLSGLLLAAPYAREDVELEIVGPLVSLPYVDMTLRVMESFGASVHSQQAGRYVIPANQNYQPRRYEIEPDASAASYFWGAAAIAGGRVLVEGLHRGALQGDVAFCDALAQMGCLVEETDRGLAVNGPAASRPLRGIDIDMNAISDTVQTLAVVALFAQGPTTIRNVAHIRHKETDRIGDLARELRKLGAVVEESPDGLHITPGAPPANSSIEVETYNDHRMAMSLALAGLKIRGVTILNPGCVKKTYPNFFADLARVTQCS